MRVCDKKMQEKNLEFNTYCFFTEENQNLQETIGLIFKDNIENLTSYTYGLEDRC